MNNPFPGVGVMIRQLSGNSETVAAYHAAIGKKITSVELVDDRLCIGVEGVGTLIASDEGQSCCESRYMRTDDNLSSFVGDTLLGIEIKVAPSIEDEYGAHDVQFLEIQTSGGVFTMASHNEHNGYYGGFAIELRLIFRP